MTDQEVASLLGKNVKVKLDESIVAEGQLLGWGDGGDVQLRDEMGFVHHCWPMLSIEEASDGQS